MTSVRSSDLDALADLLHQVVDLVPGLAHVDLGVHHAGRAHDLLDDAAGVVALEVARRGRDEHDLRRAREELVEGLRPVVERARQAEAVLDQGLLARAVALVHPADLRDGLVRLVDEADEVLREEVDQAVGALAGGAAVEDARVVLDPVAEAELAQHLHVELRALAQPVGLEQLALLLQLLGALLQLVADLDHGALDRLAVGGVVRRRPDRGVAQLLEQLAGERVELVDGLDLVAEEDRAVGGLGVGREDLERLAANAEAAAGERRVVAACTGCRPACAGRRRGRPCRRA